MSRTIAMQTEINVHQAIKAIIAFARGSFGDNDGWLTENEAIDLVAAAETILQNVTPKKAPIQPVCDTCGKPVHPCSAGGQLEWCHDPPMNFSKCPGGMPTVNGSKYV